MTDFQQISTKGQQPGQAQRTVSFQSTQLIWLFLGLLEVLLALRFLLALLAGQPADPVTALLASFAGVFLLPFAGIAGITGLPAATAIAMVAYAGLGWAFERVVWFVFYRPYTTVAVTPLTIADQRTQ